MTEQRLKIIMDEVAINEGYTNWEEMYQKSFIFPERVVKAMKQAVNEALDEAHTEGLREQLESETAWEQVQNEKLEYLESDNAGLRERVKELEAALAESEKVNFDLAAHQCDKWEPEGNGHWSCRLQAQNDRYREALEDVIIRLEEDKRFNALSIAKEALKQ